MDENEEKREKAEERAFALVDARNSAKFGDEEFKEFKVLWPFVASELRGDLTVQLLEKLNFPQKAHDIPKPNSGVRTSSLYQDFVMRVLLNSSADICSHKFDDFESIGKLVGYLRSVLKSTFLNKLKQTFTTLDQFDPNAEDDQAFDVPFESDDSLRSEFDELRGVIKDVVKDLLSGYADAQERYDLIYAHAVEGKKFAEIQQTFNARNNVQLSVSSYQKKFAATVQDLKISGQLAQLKEDIDQLKDQLDKFGGFTCN